MTTVAQSLPVTPEEVERASDRDGKQYELIDGTLREKSVGTRSLYIAYKICERLNNTFDPAIAFAVAEAVIYCFDKPNHGRRPDVSFVRLDRLPNAEIPEGDIRIPPDLVVEVLSPGNSGIEVQEKLDEYLAAGIPLVWIVNPDGQTIRVFRKDGTTQVFRANDVIENELLLPGFRLAVRDIFPQAAH